MNIDIVIDTDEAVAYARQRLGEMQRRAPMAVRTALNKAAKEIKKLDEKAAEEVYTHKQDLNKLTMDRASVGNLSVVLRDRGKSVPMTHFKPYIGSRGIKVTINKTNGRKTVVHKSGNLGFFPSAIRGSRYGQYRKKNVTSGYLKNGGATIVGRVGDSRLPIEKINSLSSPSAHGSKDVWDARVKPDGEKLLYKHLENEIERILG